MTVLGLVVTNGWAAPQKRQEELLEAAVVSTSEESTGSTESGLLGDTIASATDAPQEGLLEGTVNSVTDAPQEGLLEGAVDAVTDVSHEEL